MSSDPRRALMAAIDDVLVSPLSEAQQDDVLRQAYARIAILLSIAPSCPPRTQNPATLGLLREEL